MQTKRKEAKGNTCKGNDRKLEASTCRAFRFLSRHNKERTSLTSRRSPQFLSRHNERMSLRRTFRQHGHCFVKPPTIANLRVSNFERKPPTPNKTAPGRGGQREAFAIRTLGVCARCLQGASTRELLLEVALASCELEKNAPPSIEKTTVKQVSNPPRWWEAPSPGRSERVSQIVHRPIRDNRPQPSIFLHAPQP